MFDAIRPVLLDAGYSADSRLTMIFRRLTSFTPHFVMPAASSKAAIGDVVVNGEGRTVGVLEETDCKVPGRRPDHEADLFETLSVGEGWIEAQGPSPLSPIEVAVAATKRLHQLQVSSSVKWLATRIELPISFDAKADDVLKILIIANRNGLATVSSVSVNGNALGTVAFNATPIS